ncbi:hypothetical protein TWF788_004340 [Orbilia oligospora]|uniref:Uncharacterized protein n=1 Tax=Orbilia oligospora TaxID=2813651 RepID=A0A7C8UBA1_ORBOL|nr:hypothetical protein TWF788_004340 [Orbilia oligospora]
MSRVNNNRKAEVAELGILLAGLAHSGLTLWMMNSKQRKGVLSLAKEGKIEVKPGRAPNKPPCSEANKRKRALRELKTKLAKRKAKLAKAKEKEQRLREEGLTLEDEIFGLETEMAMMSESVPKLDET